MAVRLISATVYAKDREATLSFYREAMGLHVESERPDWGYVELKGFGGATLIPLQASLPYTPETKPGDVMLTFLVDNIEQTFARLTAAGAKVIQAPEQEGWGGVVAHVRDLDGRLVTLIKDEQSELIPPESASVF
jgi:lactoylglutathione lyase